MTTSDLEERLAAITANCTLLAEQVRAMQSVVDAARVVLERNGAAAMGMPRLGLALTALDATTSHSDNKPASKSSLEIRDSERGTLKRGLPDLGNAGGAGTGPKYEAPPDKNRVPKSGPLADSIARGIADLAEGRSATFESVEALIDDLNSTPLVGVPDQHVHEPLRCPVCGKHEEDHE